MQKGALKNQKPRVPYLTAQEDHRKNDLNPNFTEEIIRESFPKQN